MKLVGLILIAIVTFNLIIKFLIKFDDDKIIKQITRKEQFIITILISISTTVIYLRYNGMFEFVFYYILSIYLIITGYIDQKTKKVYFFLNVIVFFIGIVYIIKKYSMEVNSINSIFCVIIYNIVNIIFAKMNYYGSGDMEIFSNVSLFLAFNYNRDLLPLALLLINVVLSNIFMLVLYHKYIDIKGMRLKENVAFAPCIALSTLTLLII
ncbi:MAG: prepilin peptidase [Clostridium paraputrificum]